MKGAFQGENEIIINSSREKVWQILTDGTVLSRWMRIVKHTTSRQECLGAVRSCDVEMNGKMGKVREKCVLFEEPERIGWEMQFDTFGFSKMFNNYGFSFELEPLDHSRTRVVNKGFYDPKNFVVSMMNALFMRKKSAEIRMTALTNLKQLAESLTTYTHDQQTDIPVLSRPEAV